MSRTTTEAQVVDRFLEKLAPAFEIRKEVWGTHLSGSRLRVDAIVSPRDIGAWKDDRVNLAIEFKDMDFLRVRSDTRDYTRWLAQCVDYANTNWDGVGFCHVFACPGFLNDIPMATPLVPKLLGQLGVGELKPYKKYGLSFMLHDSHRIWSEQGGVRSGARWSMARKVGAR